MRNESRRSHEKEKVKSESKRMYAYRCLKQGQTSAQRVDAADATVQRKSESECKISLLLIFTVALTTLSYVTVSLN